MCFLIKIIIIFYFIANKKFIDEMKLLKGIISNGLQKTSPVGHNIRKTIITKTERSN